MCSLSAGISGLGAEGNGLSIGIESCCLCDAEAMTGDVIAKKESRSPAVTLPAE